MTSYFDNGRRKQIERQQFINFRRVTFFMTPILISIKNQKNRPIKLIAYKNQYILIPFNCLNFHLCKITYTAEQVNKTDDFKINHP